MTEQQLAVVKQALEALEYLAKPTSTGWSAEAKLIKRDAAITDLQAIIDEALTGLAFMLCLSFWLFV